MQSSVFGRWAYKHPVRAYILWPAFLGLAFVALYFSHVTLLQSFVAPPEGGGPFGLPSGYGAMRVVQVFILLSALFFLVRCLMASRQWSVRIVVVLLLLATASISMEELDLGTTLASLVSGQPMEASAPGTQDAFDVEQSAAEQLASIIKLGASAILLAVFVLASLLMNSSRNRTVTLLAPPYWILASIATAVVVSRLAAWLNQAGLGEIQGVPGALTYDIAEFGELVVYYVIMIYAAILHERIIKREEAWAPRRGVITR